MLGLGFWDQVQKVRTLTAFWGPKVRVRSTRVRTKGLGCTKPTNQIAVLPFHSTEFYTKYYYIKSD